MIFLKKKNKKNSDPKPAKKKSPWKRNSWLRLNLPDDFSSTIEIPQLQSEKIQTSVFAVNKPELNLVFFFFFFFTLFLSPLFCYLLTHFTQVAKERIYLLPPVANQLVLKIDPTMISPVQGTTS
jgi:hypothetical protein